MKQVRTHAFSVPDVGVWLWPHELQAVFGLPGWFLALLVHLVARSNFKTGAGRTGYGELINALTPDQPERGPRLWAPSRLDVQRALRRLEALRIVAVDKLFSEQVQSINFLVSPRQRRGVSRRKLEPEFDTGSTEVKRPKRDTGIRHGLSTEILNPRPLTTAQLSTGEGRARARQVLDGLRAARGEESGAPKGA